MKTILIIDDEPAARYGLRRALESKYRIAEADSAESAQQSITTEDPDLVLLDIVLPGQDGLSFLKRLRAQGNEIPVLMVSALDTARKAVEALQLGAADYLVKGFELDELRQRVANLLKLSTLEKENDSLRRRLITEGQFGQMIGNSKEMRRAFEMADRVAQTDSTVLILGESGTGKDLLAQEIHVRSPRANKPYVAVNCAALPETLIESELFGYERGAFTGAMQQKKGRFEQAHGGTIFLDEIGDMNAVSQAKVLRALENRKIERLGGSQTIDVDVRVISATHRDLPAEIAAGGFCEGLYYRLRVVTLELPPLRAHKEDLAMLVDAFLGQLEARHKHRAHVSPEALSLLRRYDWPGNVRELRNALERTLVLCDGDEITSADLPEEIREYRGASSAGGAGGAAKKAGDESFLGEADFREAKRQFEIVYLRRKLEEHHWNVSQTAAEVGLHRQSLQEKLRELGIQRPGK